MQAKSATSASHPSGPAHIRAGRFTAGVRRQRGASAIIGAAVIFLLLVLIIAGIDVGNLYAAKRRLQTDANMAALDAARIAGGCQTGVPVTDAATLIADAVNPAIVNNYLHPDLLSTSAAATVQQVAAGNQTSVAAGGVAYRGFIPYDASNPQPPDAAQVTLTTPMPLSLVPGLVANAGGTLLATATAVQQPNATFYVGSDLTDFSLLNDILGVPLAQGSLLDYQQLASVSIPLADVKIALGVPSGATTTAALANIQTPLPDALNSLADSLTASGQNAAAQVFSALAGIVDPNRKVLPGDLITVESLLEQAANDLPVNTLQLLEALATDAAKPFPVALPLGVLPPGLTARTYLQISNPAQFGTGPAGYNALGEPYGQAAKTFAGTIGVRISADSSVLGLASGGQPINVGLDIPLGPASGTLNSLTCPNINNGMTATFGVDLRSSLASVNVGTFDGDAAAYDPPLESQPLKAGTLVTLKPLGLLGLITVSVNQVATVDSGTSTGSVVLTGVSPNGYPTQTASIGSGVSLSNLVATATGQFLGSLQCSPINICSAVGDIAKAIDVTVLQPVLNPLDPLIGNALQTLGIQPSKATTWVAAPPKVDPPVIISERLSTP